MAKRKKKRSEQVREATPSTPTPEAAQLQSGSRATLVKTCLLFGVYLVGLHAFTWLIALKGYIKWGYGTARVVSSILNGMGIQNILERNMIYLRNDTWNVTSECTAVNAVFLYVAFLLAYAAAARSKVLGLAAGIPLILAANVVRLVALGWVTEYWPTTAHLFHDYVWETVFLFFIVGLWFVWIDLVVNREKTATVPG